MSAGLAIYRAATDALAPAIAGLLWLRRRRGREDPVRFGERLGIAGRARPPGPLVWVHGASVGEALSALPLIERLRATRPRLAILVTTGTVTSARLLAERLPEGVVHQYAPVDRRRYVRRFLDHWRPSLALWIESDLWPNLIGETARRGVPMALVNARMSPRSFERWRRFGRLVRPLVAGFALCLAQSPINAAYYERLGARDVRFLGNLKHTAPPLPFDPAALEAFRAAAAGRPCWIAASTHHGEERIAGEVHRTLAPRHSGLLTIVAPRHPARGDEIARELGLAGLRVARRSAGALPDADTDLYLVDTLGELGLFYRAAPIAFIGGSLVPHGGQNLLEAARLGAAVLHGPWVRNFEEIAAELDGAGAAREVADAAALAAAVAGLFADPPARAAMGDAAARVAASRAQVLDAVLEALAPLLDGIDAGT